MKKNTTVTHATLRHKSHIVSGGKSQFAHIVAPSFRTLLFLLAAGMFLFSCNEDIKYSSKATITSLTLTVGSTDYEITFTDTQYTLRVGSYGTPIPATVGVKNIVLSAGATTDAGDQLSVTNNAVTLTVTAADGTTKKTYTVTLAVSLSIASFTFEVPDNESMALDEDDRKRIVGKINQEAKTITFDRQSAYVHRDKLKATFEVSEEGAAVQVAGVDQESGTTEQDFMSPVSYVVSAEGAETTTYTVTLTGSTLATIEDDNFRAKLKDLVPDAFTEDELDITHDDVVNKDGGLDVSTQTPKMTSLKGIEFFTALDTLSCSYNALTSLDVSRNTALTSLKCSDNSLTSLNVSGNTALTVLACSANTLASLNLSENTALTSLSCRSNRLASLDLSKNTALMSLNCESNKLASLDVSKNTALTTLRCSGNDLTSLDVSANTALTHLWCFGNSLSSLDMTGMRSIAYIGSLNIGAGTGTDNLLVTLRVNTAVQDRTEIVAMKTARGTNLTITTVDDEGKEKCANYAPKAVALGGGKCN